MSNQYPGQPGQPGDLPPTQVAPGSVPPQQGPPGYPQQPGYPPQQPQQPQQPYGAPGGGGFPPPPGAPGGYGAPPPGGGKKTGLILGIVGGVLLLLIALFVLLVWPVGLLLDDDDDDGDADRPKVTATVTQSTDVPTDVTTPPTTDLTTDLTTDVTTPPTTDTGGQPTEDPQITSMAYLNSLVEGNCLAVEGLSTPEWWQATFGTQRSCERQSDNSAEMTTAIYNSWEEPVDNGDGTITLVGDVTDSSDGTDYTATWILAPSPDGTTWLVDGFNLV